jgi:peroxiredoxin
MGAIMRTRFENLAIAPDFELVDTRGNKFLLSDYRERQTVVLVFTRGFI